MSNFTTNEEDQREAAKLQARLRNAASDDDGNGNNGEIDSAATYHPIPNVTMAEGKHKYVLMSAVLPNSSERQNFVVSSAFASYHRDAAEPMVAALESSGYKSVAITGGGRISLDTNKRSISVYGFSYGFGLADHALSVSVIKNDERYKDFDVTWSNEGY
ncbi:unnamed protein product [Pseudo-nitzschia multistriata]|uniref:Uncharacterized protein n=1 Tax=Pseudo-nitzschia multistriata TaxID=183589 RepID=A0A448ZIE4_9STRA|nr:unnamed protein product [Pseudo-nitzschia multistriata]